MNKIVGMLGISAFLIGSGMVLAGNAAAAGQQTMCPVTGGSVNHKLFVDYHGKRIYVCCKSCMNEVWKDPALYVARLEQVGVELDRAEGGAE